MIDAEHPEAVALYRAARFVHTIHCYTILPMQHVRYMYVVLQRGVARGGVWQ